MTTMPPLIVLVYGEERIMVPRPTSYEAMVNVAPRQFPRIPSGSILLKTRDLEICQGVLTTISSDSWPYVRDKLQLIKVVDANTRNGKANPRNETSQVAQQSARNPYANGGRGRGWGHNPYMHRVPTVLPPEPDFYPDDSCGGSDSEIVEPGKSSDSPMVPTEPFKLEGR